VGEQPDTGQGDECTRVMARTREGVRASPRSQDRLVFIGACGLGLGAQMRMVRSPWMTTRTPNAVRSTASLLSAASVVRLLDWVRGEIGTDLQFRAQ